MGEVVGSWYVSRMGLSPWVVVSRSGHSTIIVREFCFVKCESVDSVSGRSILANRGQSMPRERPAQKGLSTRRLVVL